MGAPPVFLFFKTLCLSFEKRRPLFRYFEQSGVSFEDRSDEHVWLIGYPALSTCSRLNMRLPGALSYTILMTGIRHYFGKQPQVQYMLMIIFCKGSL